MGKDKVSGRQNSGLMGIPNFRIIEMFPTQGSPSILICTLNATSLSNRMRINLKKIKEEDLTMVKMANNHCHSGLMFFMIKNSGFQYLFPLILLKFLRNLL